MLLPGAARGRAPRDLAAAGSVALLAVLVGAAGSADVVCTPAGCEYPRAPAAAPAPAPPPAAQGGGCADGSCDAFCDAAGLAGCVAAWDGHQSLRAAKTGTGCGGARRCAAPADACAAGWAICLSDPASAALSQAAFRAAVSPERCATGFDGALVAAMSSGRNGPPCPNTPPPCDLGCSVPEVWGSEPVCCGTACRLPSCPSAVWSNATRIMFGKDPGMPHSCGSIASTWVQGVLCCKAA